MINITTAANTSAFRTKEPQQQPTQLMGKWNSNTVALLPNLLKNILGKTPQWYLVSPMGWLILSTDDPTVGQ
jgi:hypothetical protein